MVSKKMESRRTENNVKNKYKSLIKKENLGSTENKQIVLSFSIKYLRQEKKRGNSLIKLYKNCKYGSKRGSE